MARFLQLQAGSAIRPLSSGAASAMHEEIEPLLGGIVWQVRGLPLRMPFLDVFAPFATTAELLNVTGLGK